ncbi:ACP S-malonyltransferase [Actinoplanes sp. TFC3]|uniref:ACP S-malonyltransferase n=1 Tax=Actinoplanes sp. TFC3 TaxID=1710355 RepID=UPI000834462B|nr:ACP S-malonyltransferase [Actinoplanes sp. TFC3]
MRIYLFPGQGSQAKGMGDGLFDEFPELTRTADTLLGYSIKELCLQDPRGELDRTEFTQPALYVVNALSLEQRRRNQEPVPDVVAGHSLGEFNALYAAGCYSFATGLELVKKRGELMSQATGGAMAAVLNASEQEVRSILAGNGITTIDLANFNTPSQIVLSGPAADMEVVKPLFQTGRHLFMPLRTSAAFHSRYMEPARAEFAQFLQRFSFAEPSVPVISNVTAQPYGRADVRDLLARQIVSPVCWTDSIAGLLAQGDAEFEEIGHGKVLTKLVQKIRRELPDPPPRPAPATGRPELADELVRRWNQTYAIGTRVKSTIGIHELLETATPATVLFGHRAAVYMKGYRGYFDLTEIEPVG